MANRFSIHLTNRQKRWCVFGGGGLLALALIIAGAQAAMMTVTLAASGDILAGGSDVTWTISNGDLFGTPPLNCSQEIVSVSSVDSLLATGGGSYQSAIGIQNGELILTGTERKVATTGPSVYKESLLYDASGAGTPEGGCGNTGDLAEGVENVTPAVDPYCSIVLVGSGLMGSGLEYQSGGRIAAGSTDDPDDYQFAFTGSGNGLGQIGISSVSMTGAGGPGTLGYHNAVSQHMTVTGKPFTIGATVKWTSFAKTLDESPEASAG